MISRPMQNDDLPTVCQAPSDDDDDDDDVDDDDDDDDDDDLPTVCQAPSAKFPPTSPSRTWQQSASVRLLFEVCLRTILFFLKFCFTNFHES